MIVNYIKNLWDELGNNKQFYGVNYILFNQDWFYKFWEYEFIDGNVFYYLYEIIEFLFFFFILSLMDWISGILVIENSNFWFFIDKLI